MTKAELHKEFSARYGKDAEHMFFCPGRVNLIGEHIDYNGGQVMPCAISSGTWLLISRNTEKLLRFHCINFPETAVMHLQSSYSKTGKEWFNYPLGVIHQLLDRQFAISGLDMLYYGNLPIGAGLSSSASIEVLTGYALNEIFGYGISNTEIALIGKKTENEFIGVNSGIMDQFAVAMGKRDKAILLNCDTLEYEYIPFDTGDHALVIVNSNKQRTLADSKYNERFAECGAALKLLKKELDVVHLCDIEPEEFESHRNLINNRVLEMRASHVVNENRRVKLAKQSLESGDLQQFGRLMYESHQSLKELYDVSGKELDTIVDYCRNFAGCIGARMTGAGFGGCAIALVKEVRYEEFAQGLIEYYRERIGYAPDVFASKPSEGVRKIE